ncbi:gliding motility lipoprotein GldB [Winogradskyella sp. A3E31]|uniref:gliding motility lipoprotein GldB n=1 Tax=Winogradskyella sp. A3E31 TaxID=3349637 RepID=UPI00398B75CE
MKSLKYALLVFCLLTLGCDEHTSLENEIAKVDVDFTVERFDRAVANATANDLPKLKAAYPFLFSRRVPDSIWVARLNDSLQNELLNEVDDAFGDFKTTTSELKSLFQHLKFYDTNFSIPRVITLTNDVDYRNKTIVNDTLALIALDNYLGEDHRFYQNIQRYIAANMTKDQIVPDVAEEMAKTYTYQSNRRTFLDEMIFFGKLLYFKDVMIPFKTDAEKIGYTQGQFDWAEINENQIWTYFIEKELLYSTDPKLVTRFIAPAPYSKFYLELDNESPGRLGQFMGWQIVRTYAEKTGADFKTILQTKPETIFRDSKYKPKK